MSGLDPRLVLCSAASRATLSFAVGGSASPTGVAARQTELKRRKQMVIGMRGRFGELGDALAVAREAERGLMVEFNRS
ncbi:hypothetical protein ACL02S_23835 [Nocardia sp. 004]|uniref:hypothetical protein n=1 Tax=Nocardia sp. 004 TaxID=3385978 RepID=UPI0039A063A9